MFEEKKKLFLLRAQSCLRRALSNRKYQKEYEEKQDPTEEKYWGLRARDNFERAKMNARIARFCSEPPT